MAIEKNDVETLTLAGIPKKRGRPKTANARSAASRKREQLARDTVTVTGKPASEWPERVCLMILSASLKNPLRVYGLEAWEQIGRLRAFKTD